MYWSTRFAPNLTRILDQPYPQPLLHFPLHFYKSRFLHTNQINQQRCDNIRSLLLHLLSLRNFQTTRHWRARRQRRWCWRTCTPTPSTTSGWPPSPGGGRGPPPPSSPSEPSNTVSRTRCLFFACPKRLFIHRKKLFIHRKKLFPTPDKNFKSGEIFRWNFNIFMRVGGGS